MSSKPKDQPPAAGSKTPLPMEGKSETKPAEADKPASPASAASVSSADLDLNRGEVHPQAPEAPEAPESPESHAESAEQSEHAEPGRVRMDQIDAVMTTQGVVLFALSEGGDIWQLTTFGGQPQWTQIIGSVEHV